MTIDEAFKAIQDGLADTYDFEYRAPNGRVMHCHLDAVGRDPTVYVTFAGSNTMRLVDVSLVSPPHPGVACIAVCQCSMGSSDHLPGCYILEMIERARTIHSR